MGESSRQNTCWGGVGVGLAISTIIVLIPAIIIEVICCVVVVLLMTLSVVEMVVVVADVAVHVVEHATFDSIEE
jgi:hypothetical protein